MDIILRDLLVRAQCTRTEKESCTGLIRKALSVAHKARREGLLALEDEALLAGLEDDFFARMLTRVCDGVDPEVLVHIGLVEICSSGLSGVGLLRQLIIFEALQGIQKGHSPYSLTWSLLAGLGPDQDLYTPEDPEEGFPLPKAAKYPEELRAALDSGVLRDRQTRFKTLVLPLDRPLRDLIFRELGPSTVEFLVHGLDAEGRYAVLEAVSTTVRNSLYDSLNRPFYGSLAQLTESFDLFFKTRDYLEDNGYPV